MSGFGVLRKTQASFWTVLFLVRICFDRNSCSTTLYMSCSQFFECQTLFRLWNWIFDDWHGCSESDVESM